MVLFYAFEFIVRCPLLEMGCSTCPLIKSCQPRSRLYYLFDKDVVIVYTHSLPTLLHASFGKRAYRDEKEVGEDALHCEAKLWILSLNYEVQETWDALNLSYNVTKGGIPERINGKS